MLNTLQSEGISLLIQNIHNLSKLLFRLHQICFIRLALGLFIL
jgi:hypothetical protein